MNSQQFLKEALKSPDCPKNFEKIYSKFLIYQKAAINTLKEFHRVCEKNKIPYQLAFGSLLGAIRDHGQIPWDYDIDIFVPYCYRFKLIEALDKDLDKNYYYYCPEIDPNCRHFMMRLAPIGYKTEIIHVDVFWMVGVSENEIERNKMAKELAYLVNYRFNKLVKIKANSYGRLKTAAKLFLKKLYYILTPLSLKEKRFEELCSKYDFKKSKYCIQISRGSGAYLFETEKCWDTLLIDTDIGEFKISRDYENMLNMFYKGNITHPPINKCINEVVKHYKHFKYYEEHQ